MPPWGGRNAGDGVPYGGTAEWLKSQLGCIRIISKSRTDCKERKGKFTNPSQGDLTGVVY